MEDGFSTKQMAAILVALSLFFILLCWDMLEKLQEERSINIENYNLCIGKGGIPRGQPTNYQGCDLPKQ